MYKHLKYDTLFVDYLFSDGLLDYLVHCTCYPANADISGSLLSVRKIISASMSERSISLMSALINRSHSMQM